MSDCTDLNISLTRAKREMACIEKLKADELQKTLANFT
jgi:hypothetical protein